MFDFDVYFNNVFVWGNTKAISTHFSGGFLNTDVGGNSDTSALYAGFVDNKIQILSTGSTSSNYSKIRIVDIKGIKL